MSSPANNRRWYTFRLYVAGHTARSALSILNLRRFCKEHLAGMSEIEVIDIRQQPELAREAQILASPTLVKQTPPPSQRFIGDLSNEGEVLAGLGITQKYNGNRACETKP
jgi:circadian clock protein KaiB